MARNSTSDRLRRNRDDIMHISIYVMRQTSDVSFLSTNLAASPNELAGIKDLVLSTHVFSIS